MDVRAKELSYSHSGSASDLVALNHAQAIYARSLVEEETFWKQKARVRWLDEGDRKTSFFHSSVALKKARLSIGRIKNASGIWTEDPGEIGQKAVGFFQSLLAPQLSTLDESKAGRFLDFIPSLISFEDNAALLRPISLEEVKEAVFLLDGDSAPGPDGFSGRGMLGSYFCRFFSAAQEFFAGVPIPRCVASTSIVLLPKSTINVCRLQAN